MVDTTPMNQKNCSNSVGLSLARRRRYSQESISSSGTVVDDDYHFTEFSHAVQVLTGLNCLRINGIFCDVTLCVEGEEFPCHKIVLASFSPYFKAMFTGELVESQQNFVSLQGVEAGMIKLLVNYAYTSEVTITKTNVQSLLSAANLLEILPVRDACCHFMARNMDESNCLGIHCFAEAHACADLREKAKEFTLKFFCEVAKQEEFLNLSQSKLIEFIKSDNLEVEREEDVVNSVMIWFNHNPEERKKEFYKVLENVRLPLLSPYFIHDFVKNNSLISKCPYCQELIEEAKAYHMLPDRRFQLRSVRTRPRDSFGICQ